MTLRERIADWISGGALSLTMSRLDTAQKTVDWIGTAMDRQHRALIAIVAMETPGANGTVKRMAKRAREALK